MKKIYAIILSFSFLGASAQTPFDALLLSQEQAGATARSAGMGGAFGAVGGDFSSLSINPAGIGVYRSGEMSITPSILHSSTSSNYLGLSSDGTVDKFGLNNLGFVFSSPSVRDKGLVSFNVGIGYNRLVSFNREAYIEGRGSSSSLLDQLAFDANDYGMPSGDINELNSGAWDRVMAWDTYLLDDDNGYFSILDANAPVDQSMLISENGKVDEWLLSLGGNISHKFYFGANFSLRYLSYQKETFYKETFGLNTEGVSYWQYNYNADVRDYWDYPGPDASLNGDGYKRYNNQSTSGYGVNFKAGFIYRPIDALRIGVSVHTPTFYSLKETYSQRFDSDVYYFETQDDVNYTENKGASSNAEKRNDYKLNTGLKMTASMAYFIGKRGMVSVDYEIGDQSGLKLLNTSGTSADFVEANANIDKMYGLVQGIRLGGEYRLTPTFSLRGGYAHYTDAYTDWGDKYALDKIGAKNNYSLGFGYRDQNFFFDMAYVLSSTDLKHQLYYVPNEEMENYDAFASTDLIDNTLMFTVGFKF